MVAALAILLAAFITASCVLFVWPVTDKPQHVDAVLSLNGPGETARERLAISLVEEGYSSVLLFSQGSYHNTPCPVLRGIDVVCFVPSPARTVGEVEFAAHYARQHGWHSLIVVSGHEQTTRARLLMSRCFAGRTLIVPAPLQLSQLPYGVIYEWGALLKALTWDRGC